MARSRRAPRASDLTVQARDDGPEPDEAGVELGGVVGDDGDVADLAAGARRLAVVVKVRAGHRQHVGGVGERADAVHHRGDATCRGVAERETEHGTEVVLELAGDRALDGPVPGVVHTGRELVRQQRSAHVEQLDRQDADVVELGEQLRDDLLGGLRGVGSEPGRGRAVRWRMPFRCSFSTTGQQATAPSRPRTATTDSSRSKGTKASSTSDASGPPRSAHAASASSGARSTAWPLPS